jgi:hypothetical protein
MPRLKCQSTLAPIRLRFIRSSMYLWEVTLRRSWHIAKFGCYKNLLQSGHGGNGRFRCLIGIRKLPGSATCKFETALFKAANGASSYRMGVPYLHRHMG